MSLSSRPGISATSIGDVFLHIERSFSVHISMYHHLYLHTG